MTRHRHLRHRRAAFTLIEVLVVVTIIALLLALSGLGIGKSISSMQLSAAANALNGTLNHAALLARKENQPVEIRFYKFAQVENPDAHFRAYQIATLDGMDSSGNPTHRFLSEVHHLPSGVVITPNATHTTLASLTEQTPGAADSNFGPAYTYASYEIRPNGITTLPKTEPVAITMALEAQLTDPNSLPPNYRTVVINAFNARARLY